MDMLNQEIKGQEKPENLINYQRFFKEPLKEPVGLKTAILRKISDKGYKTIKDMPAPKILALCDQLLASRVRYMRFFAFDWAGRISKQYRPQDFKQFESWLNSYVDDWASCDSLCTGPIGNLLLTFPGLTTKTKKWAKSKNRWLRRAAAVSLIVPARKGLLLDEVFATADSLLLDSDDMVQKGYGWMLKEAGNRHQRDVFNYVMKHKDKMPRTALRYAIEKLPPPMRRQAMSK
jgi:3-methyladenine DNA glycosylase AlkD